MNVRAFIRRDFTVYTALFTVFAALMGVIHGSYHYFGTPFPSVNLNQVNDSHAQSMAGEIDKIKLSLASEKSPIQRGRLLGSMGGGYFELYKASRKTAYLDSAIQCFDGAMGLEPNNAELCFNAAMLCMQKQDFTKAKSYLDKTVAINPRHTVALHNLGMLAYSELKKPLEAKTYFEKSLAADPMAPLEHYMLALVALGNKDTSLAARHFSKEAARYLSGAGNTQSALANQDQMRLAAAQSCFQLSLLYATSLKNAGQSRKFLTQYLSMETDPQRKQNSINELGKYGIHDASGAK
jgi:tetratricopeptide (TPR) repeat protein